MLSGFVFYSSRRSYKLCRAGYDSAEIAEYKAALAETKQACDFNKTEDDETSAAYADFSSKKSQL